jgi:toxin-antitoxin system PIN domain toxin
VNAGYLLDVNLLIALVRDDHVSHRSAKQWFQRVGSRGWATCAMTEASFVRIISNPRFLAQVPDIGEAVHMLELLTRLPGHRFWTMDVPFVKAIEPVMERFFGHQQVTDAYLLGMAICKKGKLATFDRGLKLLAGSELGDYLELLT